jgi:hypothetical protein
VSPPSTRSASTATASRTAPTTSATRHAALERGAGDLRALGAGGEAGDRAAGVGPPPRRADAGDAGQDPHAAGVRRAAGELAERGRLVGQAELAAQPLEHLAGREHAAVERVLVAAVDPPGDRG